MNPNDMNPNDIPTTIITIECPTCGITIGVDAQTYPPSTREQSRLVDRYQAHQYWQHERKRGVS